LACVEAPSAEEDEVCSWMQECLALREKYVFREEVHPWNKHEITDPSTPKPNPNPFHYIAQPASSVSYFIASSLLHSYMPHTCKYFMCFVSYSSHLKV
jgi:AMP deaminase